MFDTLYDRCQRLAARHPLAVIGPLLLLFALAALGLRELRLDLSFQPLFASGEEIAGPTQDFERVFGQSSGAWISAVVEGDELAPAQLLNASRELSRVVSGVPHVVEILSLTEVRLPVWHRGRLDFVEPLPGYLFEPGERQELELQFRELATASRFSGTLVSPDGRRLLLAARLDLPLADRARRRVAVTEFRERLEAAAPRGVRLSFSGVSVVEDVYESAVLSGQLTATLVTALIVVLLLLASFGRPALVAICMLPVSLAIPATLGLMGWLGRDLTIINTALPALILTIGIADAVHMLIAWLDARRAGLPADSAAERMLSLTGRACFLTTVTTAAGMLALLGTQLDAVREFGLCAALGIILAWLANQLLLPPVLRHVDPQQPAGHLPLPRLADRAVAAALRTATEQRGTVIATAILCGLAGTMLVPRLDIDQRFNEELPADHPASAAQAMLEQDFSGFLGPDLSLRRRDGGTLLDDGSLRDLDRFLSAVRTLPETARVQSIRDYLPRNVPREQRHAALRAMRADPRSRRTISELINPAHDRVAILLRGGDIGSTRAARWHADITRAAADVLGPDYELEIVGQWWLAQAGMRLLLRDMLSGIAGAFLLVLPLMWLALRDRRLFVAAVWANTLPLLLPVALMALTGMSLRIGTVVVLSIAFGIVVDNTVHITLRLRDTTDRSARALRGTGRAVLFTTLALVGGFASMLGNELLAIRDMGIIASITFLTALLADLVLLPALYVPDRSTTRLRGTLSSSPVATPPPTNPKRLR